MATQILPGTLWGPFPGGVEEPVPAGFTDGTAVTIAAPPAGPLQGVAGALATPSTTPLANATSAPPLRGFMDHFYFRIWVIPHILDAQNPQRNTPIPVNIWNSYLVSNTVEDITSTDADGLTLDLAEGSVFDALELREVNITITDDAPYSIDANFNFDFTLGGSTLRFLASLADILPIDANTGIQEQFDWLTDVLTNYDGTEQRIALRPRPRRKFIMALTLLDDADRKALYDKLYKTIALSIIVPAYQYQSQLKQDTVIGDNKIYCNPVRADLRAGESVILATADGLFFFYRVETVNEDHVVISTAFAQVIKKRTTRVVGGFTGRLPDNSALAMRAIEGSSQLTISMVDSRDQIAYPDYPSTVTLPLMGSFPMLLRRPLADSDAPEAMGAGIEVIDNDTGKPAQYTAWDQRYISGERNYLINWLFDKDEMQFWRVFLDYCRGRQHQFYTPTYRQDLVPVEDYELLTGQIEVVGSEYATQYFTSPTYKHIEIESSAGTFQLEVSSVENNGSSTVLHFATPIDGDLTGATVSRISYLLLCRLGTDSVMFTHNDTYSTLQLTLRTIKE
ncbi:putative structural protein [Sphingomonas phage vB_StuS_MMDA13]|uniref:Putative structural protein n=1 Tax=Sphingomonas phage vB_StuS_MMDA13 TaxID=2686378 RepID=A0A7G3PLS5_9CAUD|nr:putative structural protein [Sphingomonas phage vB_StuS_MMDA13]QHB80452.1 putative structural protein [Sphingomonas phage vB_StuS_MMDA13]